MNIVATNRKAQRDYSIVESVEAGIELKGSEVKSLRSGKASFNDSFCRIEAGQVILYNLHISPYAQASYLNVEPTRPRRLLLHKHQIMRWQMQLKRKGLTLIPLKIYFNDRGIAKVEVALAKGKKLFDKRQDIKRREEELAIKRIMRKRG